MDANVLILGGAVVIAAGVGILTGLLGVGGGFLITPLLVIVLRIPAAEAIGTGLAVITLNSTVGILRRRGSGTVDVKLAWVTSIGMLLGVVAGQQLMVYLRDVPPLIILGRTHDALEYLVLCAFVIVLCGVAAFMYMDLRLSGGTAPARRVGLLARVKTGPWVAFTSLEEPRIAVLPLIGAGALIGVFTGFLGVGGGVLWLPVLVYLVGQRAAKAAGTSLLLVWMSSLLGSGLNILHGNVDLWLLGVMVLSGTAGTWYGTHLGLKMAGPRLRFCFIFVVLFAVVLIAGKLIVVTF